MRKSVFIFSAFFILLSCSDDSASDNFDSSKPYYKFTNSDANYLLKKVYRPNAIINFKNQNNEALSFKVISNEQERKLETMGSFWGTSSLVLYYYDCRTINLKSLTHNGEYTNFKINIYKGANDITSGGFYFYLWNEFPTGQYLNNSTNYSFSNATNTMQVNGTYYSNVIHINSESIYSYNVDNYNQNVNKLYYDLNNGVIGFDDLEGNEWRLVN